MAPRQLRTFARGLSVKEAADVAGVTPRTIRHYHAVGVLPEPPRDPSGYRRYGGKEVVELVRVVRLRALGMPLPEIAERVSAGETDDISLSDALTRLADEVDGEIARLTATRDRLRELARSETFDQPVKALTRALQDRGVLGPADDLAASEKWAAAVLDALHPDGMSGVLAHAGRLLGEADLGATLGTLRRRLGSLTARTTDDELADLAGEVAALLSADEVQGRVDLDLVDLLLRDRLRPVQRRFMRALRTHLESPEQATEPEGYR
ncbi:MAG: MerR family transcriptional regulator [Jatrophihabitans sp.]|uniref:helix-turn-helix domain-containing protein n=1 Tax=Jatrophihabitans sp. TaxID=1932789 RepID=UPI003F804016